MRKIALAFVLCLPLSVASCGTNVPILNGQSASQAAPEAFANAQKALTVAHMAFNAISTQIISATQQGILKGANAAAVQAVYRSAKLALDVGDNAEAAGNTTSLIQAVQNANSAISQAKKLIGGN